MCSSDLAVPGLKQALPLALGEPERKIVVGHDDARQYIVLAFLYVIMT